LSDEVQVRAAGGVIVRGGVAGPEVAIVHRPRYDDWSLPKGKLEEGEAFEDGALREVEEETGLRCELGRELTATRYRDKKGRPKVVRYWSMTILGEDTGFILNEEVDELLWLPPPKAMAKVDYDHDARLIAEATTPSTD